jgi:CRISPR-associated endonuclease/helicase Cas3
MNILLVSQCHKNALKETRRIIDQFAERCGERTWKTAITKQGLDKLRQLLRKTARKNTAVACHWIHKKNHSELIWIVGNTQKFSSRGTVPTNSTKSDVLRKNDENDWHTADMIRSLSAIAALFHDLGKANDAFQAKLKSKRPIADLYRHEWVSLRIFEAFVGKDDDRGWLKRLADIEESNVWINNIRRDGLDEDIEPPFRKLPPLAQIVGWLVVSHHRLPMDIECGKKFSFSTFDKIPFPITVNWCGTNNSKCSPCRLAQGV